jgi:predicted SprT family Zn-dependent metalloprotease
MSENEVEKMFESLSKKYNLAGYSFMFDRAKSRRGRHIGIKKLITMSKYNIQHRSYEATKNTLLHEVAHAIAYMKYGRSQKHNSIWRDIAVSIGCDGKTCSEN